MSHTIKLLLRAADPATGKTIREKWVYDQHTAECFAYDWHMKEETRDANIYIDDKLIIGYERELPAVE